MVMTINPARKSGFRAEFRPDCNRGNIIVLERWHWMGELGRARKPEENDQQPRKPTEAQRSCPDLGGTCIKALSVMTPGRPPVVPHLQGRFESFPGWGPISPGPPPPPGGPGGGSGVSFSGSLAILNSDFWAGFRQIFGHAWPPNPSRTTGLVLQCRHQQSAPQTNSKLIAAHWHSRILGFYPSALARKPSKSGPGGPDSSPRDPGKP